MSHKRPLDAAAPEEQEPPRSPRKRLRRTVLVMMWLERRRARAVTLEHMVRQAQLDMLKMFFLLMVLVARLSSMESLLLDLPNLLQRSVMGSIEDMVRSIFRTEIQGLAEQFATFQRSVVSMEDSSRSVIRTEMQEPQAALLPIGVYEPSRSVMVSIEDSFQSVLPTEMQEPQAALLPNGVYEPSREISEGRPETGGSSGVVKLRFVDADRPKDPLYTGCPVQWQNGEKAKVAIFRNGKQIIDGDLSKLQIEILPVHADFFTELDDFTKEDFSKQIYMPKGKESVLATVNLKNGEAYLGSFSFTESSYRKNLRLAARVKRHDPADRVQEAITDPFVVKDRRSESNEKSSLPSKEDLVHRLKKISQKGKRCILLAENNIIKVKHLMRKYHEDKSGLQKLTGMKKEDWNTMIKHATTCDPGDEIYSYRVAEENCELLYNDFYDLVGMIINESYVPVGDLDQFQQRKVNNWKLSAYKKFEERENSGGLIPDYLMINGQPACAVPLNNEAGPSVQARPTWHYPNNMAAQQEFGEQHQFRQQNGFSPAKVLSNNDAGPSMQETILFSHPEELIAYRELCQHDSSMQQNETPYYLTQGNTLNSQVSFSRQLTIPPDNFLPVPGASLIDQSNGYLSSSTTDAPGTSCAVTDGITQGTSSLDHVMSDFFCGLSPIEELLEPQAHLADQCFTEANNEQLPNSNYQFDDYEHDSGNQ